MISFKHEHEERKKKVKTRNEKEIKKHKKTLWTKTNTI